MNKNFCGCCSLSVQNGTLMNGIIVCTKCLSKTSICPKCKEKFLVDKKCMSCGFNKCSVSCYVCGTEKNDGALNNGCFQCTDCSGNMSDPSKKCPKCHQFTLVTKDEVGGMGTIAGGDGWGTIVKSCECGYKDSRNY